MPSRFNNPPGIVSIGSGAFPSYDSFRKFYGQLTPPFFGSDLFDEDFFVPYQENWQEGVDPLRTPQNGPLLQTETIFEQINEIPGIKNAFVEKGGDVSVSAYSMVARGAARWITWDLTINNSSSKILDDASLDKLDDYLLGRYLVPTADFPRNDIPFSALTSWYLSGLDHEAHNEGMGVYKAYFERETDDRIKQTVDRLKALGEFDDKIFIITSDHGATAMPTDLSFTDKKTNKVFAADVSCDYKVDDFDDPDIQKPEQANNNLHIWELAEVMKLMPTGEVDSDGKSIFYKILAPDQIVGANKGETTVNNNDVASFIAALNGPMAHIYAKGSSLWNEEPQSDLIIKMADLFQAVFSESDGPIPQLSSSVEAILIRPNRSADYSVYNGFFFDSEGKLTLSNPIGLNQYFDNKPEFLDAVNRIQQMNHPDRSGDIILLMKFKTQDDTTSRYTSGVSCKAWHGSLSTSDSYVPLILAYPGGNKEEIDSIVKKVCPNGQCEGNWRTTDIAREIIVEQYADQ